MIINKLFIVIALLLCTYKTEAQNQKLKYQFEFSLGRNSTSSFYAISILYVDREEIASQTERASWYIAATQLRDVTKRVAFKYGLSVSDKGYREDLLISHFSDGRFDQSQKNIQMIYLGTPLTLAFNLKNSKRLFSGFIEAGVLPEILLHQTKSKYMNFNLNRFGLSYIVSVGIKINIPDKYAILIYPKIILAAIRYDDNRQDNSSQIINYNPLSSSIAIGFQM